jgi:hypothetical protein
MSVVIEKWSGGRVSLVWLSALLALVIAGCTDYAAQIEDAYGDTWANQPSVRQSSTRSGISSSSSLANQPYGSQSSSRSGISSSSPSSNTFVDSRDGNIYSYKTIAGYTWMMENLRYAGGTYTAQEALAACPDGWRLPGSTEYTALENYAISVTGASSRHEVKKVIPWFEMKNGFNMPDGTRYWTSEKSMDGVQDRYDMYYHFAIINGALDRYPDDAWRGKQVRCVRN